MRDGHSLLCQQSWKLGLRIWGFVIISAALYRDSRLLSMKCWGGLWLRLSGREVASGLFLRRCRTPSDEPQLKNQMAREAGESHTQRLDMGARLCGVAVTMLWFAMGLMGLLRASCTASVCCPRILPWAILLCPFSSKRTTLRTWQGRPARGGSCARCPRQTLLPLLFSTPSLRLRVGLLRPPSALPALFAIERQPHHGTPSRDGCHNSSGVEDHSHGEISARAWHGRIVCRGAGG